MASRTSGVPAPHGSTLYHAEQRAEYWQVRAKNAEDALMIAYHRIELLQGFARKQQRGEEPSWWERRAVLVVDPAPLPDEMQALYEARFLRRQKELDDYILAAQRKAEMTAEQIYRKRIEQIPTHLLPPVQGEGETAEP